MQDQLFENISPRIMVIDPDQSHCQLLSQCIREFFADKQCEITFFHDAESSLAAPITKFNIVLLDWNLLGVTGLEVLSKLIKKSDIPIIILTNDEDLPDAIEALNFGAQDYIAKHGNYFVEIPPIVKKCLLTFATEKENERLVLRNQWMLHELQKQNAKLEESMKRLQEMVTTDELTGLVNRRGFADHIMRNYIEAHRYDLDLCCCMIDLDNYKMINDTLGHLMGDEVLKITANEVRASLRATDIAARYGGDEFILLFPHTAQADAINVIRRIQANIAASQSRLRVPVTMSIGIASLQEDTPESAEGLIAMADRALYHAKQTGKNKIVAFSELSELPDHKSALPG